MLASSRRDYPLATVATQRVTGESTKETLKPLRREGRIASAEPVCSCAFSYVQLAHETAGAARTRSSLRPLFEGRSYFESLGQNSCRENANAYPPVIARPKRAIQYSRAL